jgi:hypothetical protein
MPGFFLHLHSMHVRCGTAVLHAAKQGLALLACSSAPRGAFRIVAALHAYGMPPERLAVRGSRICEANGVLAGSFSVFPAMAGGVATYAVYFAE